MGLYLSSFRIGDHPEVLREFCGGGRVAIISNALDFIPDDARRRYEAQVYSPRYEFSALGLEASDFDLRRYFGNPKLLRAGLKSFGMIWAMAPEALYEADTQSSIEQGK